MECSPELARDWLRVRYEYAKCVHEQATVARDAEAKYCLLYTSPSPRD